MGRGSLSAFFNMDTSNLHPSTRGGGGGGWRLQSGFARLSQYFYTFRNLFKASDTFDDFQVLMKMADSHGNIIKTWKHH